MKIVWPDSKVLLQVEDVYTITITTEDNYVFTNCSDRTLSIIINYDYTGCVIYNKERVIDILKLFKKNGIDIGLEGELWLVKEST